METTSTSQSSSIGNTVQALQNTSDFTTASQSDSTQGLSPLGSDFSQVLQGLLGTDGQQEINEEEFFSSIIEARLKEESPEAATYYHDQFTNLSKTMARPDGYVPVEDVAKAALKATVAAGKIGDYKAQLINSFAFYSAQLDDVKQALYDSLGDTRAVSTVDGAMTKLQLAIEDIDNGTVAIAPRSLDIPSNKGPVDASTGETGDAGSASEADSTAEAGSAEAIPAGNDGKSLKFSWKEVASDGNLAVLVPQPMSDNIKGVNVYDSNGTLVTSGKYSKITGDNRAVYRFAKPGSEYGKNLDVVINYKNGNMIAYHIPDGGQRHCEFLSSDANAVADMIEKSKSNSAVQHLLAAQNSSGDSGTSSSTSASAPNSSSFSDSSSSSSTVSAAAAVSS